MEFDNATFAKLALERSRLVNRNLQREHLQKRLERELETIGNLEEKYLNDLVARWIESAIDDKTITEGNFERLKNYSVPLDSICSKYRNVYKFSWDDVRYAWYKIYSKYNSINEVKQRLNEYIINLPEHEYKQLFKQQADYTKSCEPRMKEIIKELIDNKCYYFNTPYTYSVEHLRKQVDPNYYNSSNETDECDEEEEEMNDCERIIQSFSESIKLASTSNPINYNALISLMYEARRLSDFNYWDEDLTHEIYTMIANSVTSEEVNENVLYSIVG